MARQPRLIPPGSVVHVVNRGNERRRLFNRPSDYDGFLELLDRALLRHRTRVLAYALMPNHWHLVLWPEEPEDMSKFLHRLSTAHAARFRYVSGTAGLGHVYQGRYRSTSISDDVRYVQTILYVEANPLRARLVRRAEQWPWTSLSERLGPRCRIVDGPVPLAPADVWVDIVNRPVEP